MWLYLKRRTLLITTRSETTAVDTIPKQKAYIANQTALLSHDMNLFKRVYKHTFVCSRERGQKALPLDNAIVYWQMLFSPPGMKWVTSTTNWLDLWVEYLQKKWTKSVNKDMWNQTLEFFLKTMQDETLSFWSEDGAWPSVIDDFVGYVKELRGPDKMETD
jgi:DCN1-like protein 1/2